MREYAGHGITDRSSLANPLSAAPWQYTVEDVPGGGAKQAARDLTAGLPPADAARLSVTVSTE